MRERIEQAFESWGRLAYRRAWVVIALMVALVAGLMTQLPKIALDASTEGFFHEGDPVRVAYDEFRERFGTDQLILVAVRPPDVFEPAALDRLRALHRDIENEVPLLVEVTSLVNARQTLGVGDELQVGEFLEEWPESEAAAQEARRRALANPLYVNNLVSPDGKLTTIVIETEVYSRVGAETDEFEGFDDAEVAASPGTRPAFLTGDETAEIVSALMTVLDRHRSDDFELYLTGSPVFVDQFQASMRRDMGRFAGLAILMIAVLLGALFRRVAGVVLPMLTVILSLLCTLSLMAASGTPLTLPTQILPSFLLAVGVGGSVHILVIFYQARRRGESRADSIAYALGHSGLAVMMTSLTTAVGLLSFLAAELRPISHFGVFGPLGVMVALLFTVVLLPALIAVFPMRDETEAGRQAGPALSQRLLLRTGDFATRRAGWMVAVWAVLLVVAAAGVFRVGLSHDPVRWWPEAHPMRAATELMNSEMGGAMFLELLVETGAQNGMHDPELLARLEKLQAEAETFRSGRVHVGKSVSLSDVVKEIHQALNENRPDYRVVPDQRELVAQELLLFENSGSDDLESFVDPQFETGRVTFKVPFVDSIEYGPFVDQLGSRASELLGTDVKVTGMMVLISHTITAVMHTLVRSYALALLFVMPLLVLLIGSLRFGLTAIIPNLAPIVLTLGLMGWFGIGLDTFTLLIGCIAIGLAVDDTIHFMHNFRRYYARSGDVPTAVRETLETTGQALLFTSLVLSMGFLLYTLAEMRVLFNFGFLTAFTIIAAFLADILLAPALLVLVARPSTATAAQPLEMEATR